MNLSRQYGLQRVHKPALPRSCVDDLSDLTEEYQKPWLVVEKVHGMSCKSIDDSANECQKCNDGIDWRSCEYLGWNPKLTSIDEDGYKAQLDHYRSTVFKPLLNEYIPNREREGSEGVTVIFLTIAARHVHFELPDGTFAGYDVKSIKPSQERKIICIPMLPTQQKSVVNVKDTSEHLQKCLELVLDRFSTEEIEVNTYYGSGNIGIRSYLDALMMFVYIHKDDVSKWNFFDYHSDKWWDTEFQPKDKNQQNNGYHVNLSLPHRSM